MKYTADKASGFNAIVERIGKAGHPAVAQKAVYAVPVVQNNLDGGLGLRIEGGLGSGGGLGGLGIGGGPRGGSDLGGARSYGNTGYGGAISYSIVGGAGIGDGLGGGRGGY